MTDTIIKHDDSFDDLFTKNVFLLGRIPDATVSVRTYNLCRREGVETVGDLLSLTSATIKSWRNHNTQTLVEINEMQKRLLDLMIRERSTPHKEPGEGQTNFTIRQLSWARWWEGHDAVCLARATCDHENPYDRSSTS